MRFNLNENAKIRLCKNDEEFNYNLKGNKNVLSLYVHERKRKNS